MTTKTLLMTAPAAGGGGGPAFVQSKDAAAQTVVLDSTPTDGNLLVVCTGSRNDPAGFASMGALGYTLRVVNTAGIGAYSAIWSKVASSDSATITVTEAMGLTPLIAALEFDSALSIDQTATDRVVGGTSLTLTTAALASSPGIAVVALFMLNTIGAFSLSDSFSDVTTVTSGIFGYKILDTASAVSVTATWTTSRNHAGSLATWT